MLYGNLPQKKIGSKQLIVNKVDVWRKIEINVAFYLKNKVIYNRKLKNFKYLIRKLFQELKYFIWELNIFSYVKPNSENIIVLPFLLSDILRFFAHIRFFIKYQITRKRCNVYGTLLTDN